MRKTNYWPIWLFLICGILSACAQQNELKNIKTLTINLGNLPKNAKPLEMVPIKAGTFIMGSAYNERGRHNWEWPQHRVTITNNFYLSKYEITQAQWEAVMGSNPSKGYGVGANYPVYYVTWNDCQEFIRRLNQTGQGLFRLPTEAEWEYACRAGTTTRFSHGDVLECDDVCEFCEEHDHFMWWCGNNHPYGSKEVGQKLPNPFGLYDMHGNVFEWCHDRWEEPYESKDVTDPQGPKKGMYRVLRGGGWENDAAGCRSAFRYGYSPDDRRSSSGFGLRLTATKNI